MAENENAPQISVVIPMYNVEKFVGESLDSLLCQTFQDFEVIVLDDCSTDESRQVVEKYQPKFNGRLRIFSTEKKFRRLYLAAKYRYGVRKRQIFFLFGQR